MKSAQSSAQKFVERASGASSDYVDGARSTSKDQNAAAIAAAPRHQQALQESFTRNAYAKGLQEAGKQSWLDGVTKKGANRFAEGVSTAGSKYATKSGAYDSARAAASSMPRGLKGSDTNLARVKTVVSALRSQKVGSTK